MLVARPLLPSLSLGIFLSCINFNEYFSSDTVNNLQCGRFQTIVVYGTSLTAGGAWVDQLRSALQNEFGGLVSVINSGQSGADSDWGLKNVRERVVSKHPDCVFIEFSINDMVSNTITKELSETNLSSITDSILLDNPDCEIVIMTMNPRTDGSVDSSKNAAYYCGCRMVAHERHFILVDNYSSWIELRDKNIGLYMSSFPTVVTPYHRDMQR
jgi:acyl-CoA thioesterase-1